MLGLIGAGHSTDHPQANSSQLAESPPPAWASQAQRRPVARPQSFPPRTRAHQRRSVKRNGSRLAFAAAEQPGRSLAGQREIRCTLESARHWHNPVRAASGRRHEARHRQGHPGPPRSALAGQAHVPFCKGFEGHQGTLAAANRSYFLFCSAFFGSPARWSHNLVKAARSSPGNFDRRPCRGCRPGRCPSASAARPNPRMIALTLHHSQPSSTSASSWHWSPPDAGPVEQEQPATTMTKPCRPHSRWVEALGHLGSGRFQQPLFVVPLCRKRHSGRASRCAERT
jgi:hypothetical protein